MNIRADIAELLHLGLSDNTIANRLHCAPVTVSRTRASLKLPKVKPGVRPAPTAEAAFHAHTQPTDNGHLIWTGHISRGTPMLRHAGRLLSAYRVAWRIRTGREPVGHVRPTCEVDQCVAPSHVDDREARRRNTQTYAAIFGHLPTVARTGPHQGPLTNRPVSHAGLFPDRRAHTRSVLGNAQRPGPSQRARPVAG